MKRDEQTIQYRTKLDKLEQQIAENKARQKKAADDAKILRRKKATAERNMRTHRLCVLGALLEKQLKEPGSPPGRNNNIALHGSLADEYPKRRSLKAYQ